MYFFIPPLLSLILTPILFLILNKSTFNSNVDGVKSFTLDINNSIFSIFKFIVFSLFMLENVLFPPPLVCLNLLIINSLTNFRNEYVGFCGVGFWGVGSNRFGSCGVDSGGFGSGFGSDGFDSDGFDSCGFDSDGFDSDGFDSCGFDSDGFDSCGFDSDGFGSGFGSGGSGSESISACRNDLNNI